MAATLERKPRKEKEIVSEFEYQLKDIRQQLNEQLKCLDARLESHLAMLWELQDFYKRRAEVELEYSKGLDRLVKNIMLKHKAEKQKREFWPGYSTYTCWQTLLASTKRQSKDHAILSDVYTNHMSNRFLEITEDIQRIYKKCRETGFECHEELLKVLHELQSALNTYHKYHGESKQAEAKLRLVESQREKILQHGGKGTLANRKAKSISKDAEKKQKKYLDNKKKALKARNDYILCIDTANAAINKYFMDDLPDLIDGMDSGYHISLARAAMMHLSAEENIIKSRQACMDLMNKCVTDLDQRQDKQTFLELYNQPFSLPKKFEFQAHKGDEIFQISAQQSVQEELIERHKQIANRLNSLRLENEEVWKTLETAENSLMELINVKDYDTTPQFNEERLPPKSPHEYAKKRSDRLETEAFYLEKFRQYLLGNNLISRLTAKHNSIQKALGEGSPNGGPQGPRPPSLPPKPRKQLLTYKSPLRQHPKLFGGSLQEYIEATGEDIPRVVKSCIRVINLYGKHHQGVFRVSGSQHEINEFKNAFEKGEDPLITMSDGKDINSVAGVLKLYFRELKEPVFPTIMFDELVSIATGQETPAEFTERIKELMLQLPRQTYVVLRYLFAFLNHLSEYSDENMMDPYNLAICFGPTLLPIPGERDQVQFQSNVNELIKNIITHQEEIFINDGGPVYEKCIIDEDLADGGDNMSEDDEDERDNASEEDLFLEPEVLEAVAQYDFTGRTERELSFKKGDVLVLFNHVSNDWWAGALNQKEGLIPDKYITVKQRDEDRRSAGSEDDKRRSTESLPAKSFGALTAEDNLDKSASHPNIAMTNNNNTIVSSNDSPPPSTVVTNRSSYPSTTSDLTRSMISSTGSSSSGSESSPSLVSRETLEDALSHSSVEIESDAKGTDMDKSTDDLQLDIDSALAEVMSGLKSLEMQQKEDKLQMFKLQQPPMGHPKHTPDLVLDLPVNTVDSFPQGQGSNPDSPTLSTAEMFATTNQSTIKKASSMPRSTSSVSPFRQVHLVGSVGGSGGPARRSNSSSSTMPRPHMSDRTKRDGSLEPTTDFSLMEKPVVVDAKPFIVQRSKHRSIKTAGSEENKPLSGVAVETKVTSATQESSIMSTSLMSTSMTGSLVSTFQDSSKVESPKTKVSAQNSSDTCIVPEIKPVTIVETKPVVVPMLRPRGTKRDADKQRTPERIVEPKSSAPPDKPPPPIPEPRAVVWEMKPITMPETKATVVPDKPKAALPKLETKSIWETKKAPAPPVPADAKPYKPEPEPRAKSEPKQVVPNQTVPEKTLATDRMTASTTSLGSDGGSDRPERPERRAKPPLMVKPALAKKPARSPEVTKRLNHEKSDTMTKTTEVVDL